MTSPSRLARAVAPLCLALLAISGNHAAGSSDAAWQEFRDQLRNSCVAIASTQMQVGSIRVDPFGTTDYGIAVVTDAETGAEHVCVLDKASGRAQLGGALEMVADPDEPFSPRDATELAGLRAQVRATLADLSAKGLSANGQAATVAAILDGKVTPDDVAGFPAGPYRCTVFWYGFLDEGARRVGAHQCSVSRKEGGGLVVEKTTGDRFHGETAPFEDRLTAFAGRTWLEGHAERRYDPAHPANAENENFGNKVGIVLRSGERLFLVSIDERGMTEPDPTYFEILELVPRL